MNQINIQILNSSISQTFSDYVSAKQFLFQNKLLIVKKYKSNHSLHIEAKKIEGYYYKKIEEDNLYNVTSEMEKVYFKPKNQWRSSLKDIVLSGLISKTYSAYGIWNTSGNLSAYIDYKSNGDTDVHIGVCFTVEAFRGKGLMKSLFYLIELINQDSRIYLTTYEGNASMIHMLNDLGYHLYQESRDRIDGTNSLYYEQNNTIF